MELLIAGGLVALLVLLLGMLVLTFIDPPKGAETTVIDQLQVKPAGGMVSLKTALSEPLFLISDDKLDLR